MWRVTSHVVAAVVGALVAALLLGTQGPSGGGASGPRFVEAAGSCAAQTGDINADGEVDLSDAVSLLLGLFAGGPPPAPACDPPELTQRIVELESQIEGLEGELIACQTSLARKSIPATGQTKCIDALGNAVPCNNSACPGQDAFYALGCPKDDRFTDNGDGTVTDTCTSLMWQKDTADVNGDGQLDTNDRVLWCDALTYCEALTFATYDDWRLPNLRELEVLVDYGRYDPAIDPIFGVFSDWYWSSSCHAHDTAQAWHVLFFDGGTGDVDFRQGYSNFVLAVRTAP